MQEEIIEEYYATPVLKQKKDIVLQFLLAFTLSYGSFLAALIMGYFSNWYYFVSTWLLGYLFMGIIQSKLLHEFVPKSQHERSYSSFELAAWILSRSIDDDDPR